MQVQGLGVRPLFFVLGNYRLQSPGISLSKLLRISIMLAFA